MRFAIYDSDGRIDRMVISRSEIRAKNQIGENEQICRVRADTSNDSHYIKITTRKANQRPRTPVQSSRSSVPADDTTELALSKLRPGTRIDVQGPIAMQIDSPSGGTERLTFARPGRYTLTATAPWPAQPRELVIDAT